MVFLSIKIQILAFVFLAACSGSLQNLQKKFLNPGGFFKRSLSCDEMYKRTFKKKLSKEEQKKIERQAEKCQGKDKIKWAFLILENLLRRSQKQAVSLMEIKRLEKKLAQLSYTAKDYEKALKYYTSLLKKPLGPGEKFFIQYHIAESFFHLEKHSQAVRELEKCFFDGISLKQKKRASLLKGRIFMARHQFNQALLFFEKQIEEFPEEESFFREYLALIYEFKRDFPSAVRELEKIESSSPFIKQKIKNLSAQRRSRQGFPSK